MSVIKDEKSSKKKTIILPGMVLQKIVRNPDGEIPKEDT